MVAAAMVSEVTVHAAVNVAELFELEAKLLCGGKNIRDHTNEQQQILEKQRQELAEQKCREREILKKLHEEEESTIEKKGTYDSLQQEVEVKTKKLKKLFQRLQALKEDINDEQEINSFERQEKEGTIETLTRDLKLSNLVIDNFINPEDKAKFLENVKYDEDEDCWIIYPSQNLSYSHFNPAERPTSANQFRRPTTSFAAKMNKLSPNPRFKSENIAVADFAMPRTRTIDHYEPDIDPYAREAVSNLLSTAVFHVQTVDTSTDPNSDCPFSPDSLQGKNWRRTRTSTPHSRQVKAKTDVEKYPVPRGLVPK
ncbi:kinesin-like protein KIF3B [Uloborus diversus]|uniref:kinesin-like protein KIF3B n=1 Tax=Uloborus diversus TaxID=327109 RepID=UPI0024092DEB|nr:kinesin-like protein KIF3B [Uloborus diversus]